MADRLSCTAGHRTEAADLAVASGKPIAQVAADLGINEKILGRWVTVRKKELANHPVAAAAAKTETAEMRAARKCMRELELEKRVPKKPRPHIGGPGPVDFGTCLEIYPCRKRHVPSMSRARF